MTTQVMTAEDRQKALEEFVAAGKVTKLEYQGKPQYLIDWELRKEKKRASNMSTDKARRGKASGSPFFKRGAGCI